MNSILGSWNFEVTYSDFQSHETTFNCEGEFLIRNSKLMVHHCINEFLEVIVKKDGAVYSHSNKLIGLIENGSCLIIDNNPSEKSILTVTIKGEKL